MDKPWPRNWPEKAELHIFDPEGDVLLVLERQLKEDDLVEPVDEGKSGITLDPFIADEEPIPLASVEDLPEPEEKSVSCEPQAESFGAGVDNMTKPASSASASLDRWEREPRVEKVQMRASSKHLILASPIFRISLGSDTYSEGRILQIEGNFVLPLPDEDPDAMVILLNIIHGLSKKVPRRVDLKMLSKLAVVVNYRKMQEAVELWSDTWIENLKRDKSLPNSYMPERRLPWLFIFWVFRKDKDFRNLSQRFEQECDDRLEDEVASAYVGPYIPASIIKSIQENRLVAIKSMITVIHDLITKFSGPDIVCSHGSQFSCDANILGSLVKGSAIIGIWPRPKVPYPGISSKTLLYQIRKMQIPDTCQKLDGFYHSTSGHGIKDSIEALMRSLEDRMLGLGLTSFLPTTGIKTKKGKKKGKTVIEF